MLPLVHVLLPLSLLSLLSPLSPLSLILPLLLLLRLWVRSLVSGTLLERRLVERSALRAFSRNG